MRALLLTAASAGAGSYPSVTSATLFDLAISLALTGVVAWLAHGNERAKAQRREEQLAGSAPSPRVH